MNTAAKITVKENPIMKYPAGVIPVSAFPNPWELAIDCVDYPVYLYPLHYHHDGKEYPAAGETNTGRDCVFHGVVVDRDRTGDLSTISTVTGLYDTIPAKEIYEGLKRDLEAATIANVPRKLYVSGNGGKHELFVELDEFDWVKGKEKIKLNLSLNTSVDGTARHNVRVAAMTEEGEELVGISTSEFNLSARHTNSLRDRHAAFSVIIESLLTEWNETIIPTMQLMNDCEFDKAFASDILFELMDQSNIPERHQKKALDYYERKHGQSKTHNLFGVFQNLSVYLNDELSDKPERLRQFKEKISKKSQKMIEKALRKA